MEGVRIHFERANEQDRRLLVLCILNMATSPPLRVETELNTSLLPVGWLSKTLVA